MQFGNTTLENAPIYKLRMLPSQKGVFTYIPPEKFSHQWSSAIFPYLFPQRPTKKKHTPFQAQDTNVRAGESSKLRVLSRVLESKSSQSQWVEAAEM